MRKGGKRSVFSRKLKAHLEARGLTQADLARMVEMSEPTVSRWIRGVVDPPTRTVELVAARLKFESLEAFYA